MNKELPGSLQLVCDQGSLVGRIFSIKSEGSGKISVKFDAKFYGEVKLIVSKETAIELKESMFEPVRFHGEGRWGKSADGKVIVVDFHVDRFVQCRNETLQEAVDSVRSLDLEWRDDPLQYIKDISNV